MKKERRVLTLKRKAIPSPIKCDSAIGQHLPENENCTAACNDSHVTFWQQ